MRTRPFAVLAAAFALVPLALTLHAASPMFWQVSTLADFLKGDVDNVAIDSEGRVVLGRTVELLHETTAPFVWALAHGPSGEIFAGTGSEGRVIRIAGGQATTVFDAPELQAQALAIGADGTLYVGTSPDGKVYAVSPDGSSRTFFDPDDKYIWALAIAPDGALYVATGEKGIVYRVGRDGSGSPFYTSRATNVTALAFDRDGQLLVGTESPGQLLRVDRTGRAFMLLDSAYREIHAIRVKPTGDIYVTAVSGRPQPGDARPGDRPSAEPAPPGPVPTVTTEITVTAVGDVPVVSSTPTARAEPRREARGAVYRVAPDGLWESVWESADDSPYDIILDDDGVVVATGNKGKLYRLEGAPGRSTVVARAGGQQVTRFVRTPDGSLVFATSNPGKVFRLAAHTASRGIYESEVRDAGTVATWGTLRWTALVPRGTGVALSTRSGNSSTPDDTWSEWSTAYTTPAGQQVTSPKARYLQWRATLSGNGDASPALTSVTAAYLPRNVRPNVASITVHPPGIAFQRPFPTGDPELAGFDSGASDGRNTPATAAPAQASAGSPLGRRVYQKGLQTFVWKADDPDDERLQYDIYFRREAETDWRPLRLGLWDPLFTWDTTSVPDGTYLVKVVVSDAPSNSPETALVNERESVTFDIDNSAPVIDPPTVRLEGGRAVIRFVVRDAHSPIQRVEYSVDSVRWQTVFPDDGIADSLVEAFTIQLPGAIESEVLVRAVDSLNNVATTVVARPAR